MLKIQSTNIIHEKNNDLYSSSIFSSVEEYVSELGGKTAIKRILIANNGISAVKAIRSIRRFSYETFADENAIQFVVMATPEDLRANAEYIRMADEVLEVPGGSNNNNYANVMLIVDLAERCSVDAVWAGWGHASENPLLPETLRRSNRKIIFIGPPAKPMQALGDKIGSTILAQSANVPTISWNGDGITTDYKKEGKISDEIYKKAEIRNVSHALEECKRIGFPVMIKASAGGGGKGIRKVASEDQVAASFHAVQGEIPGSPIFIMKLAPTSRHLEVQLIADEYGEAIALSGRDCSVQRRHQKIVEEGPVLAPSAKVWKEMENAAIRLAKEVNYVNAGTVEYLFSQTSEEIQRGQGEGNFYFLELNPRLQVEHPVTEMITGVNLPAAQLQVAMGIPLSKIPDLRRYYQFDPFSKDFLDFSCRNPSPPLGHVIAARITAENPDAGFQPTSGAIEELNFRSTPSVWGYFSVDSSGRVHEFADSQIGHLFAFGENRERARKNIILALKELSIRGDIRTTVEYLIKMMESNDFKSNLISTSWLDERISRHEQISALENEKVDAKMVVLLGAVSIAYNRFIEEIQDYVVALERGQILSFDHIQVQKEIELIFAGIKYKLNVLRSGEMSFLVSSSSSSVNIPLDLRMLSDGGYLILLNGKSHVVYTFIEHTGIRLTVDGKTVVFSDEYNPTVLVSNASGKLARYLVPNNSHVKKGTPYVEIEVMKMYMPLLTQEEGIITYAQQEGCVLSPGDIIATMLLDDPSCIKKAQLFDGDLPNYTNAKTMNNSKPLYSLRICFDQLNKVLEGYAVPTTIWKHALQQFFVCLKHPDLLINEILETLSIYSNKIPSSATESVMDWIEKYKVTEDVQPLINNLTKIFEINEIPQEVTLLIRDLTQRYHCGYRSNRVSLIRKLMLKYLEVEMLFSKNLREVDVVNELRTTYKDDLNIVYEILRSHMMVSEKNSLLICLLEECSREQNDLMDEYLALLEDIANLKGKTYSLVALEARHVLMDSKIPSFTQRCTNLQTLLYQVLDQSKNINKEEVFSKVIDQPLPIFDILINLLDVGELDIQHLSLDLYVRRIYRSYMLESFECNSKQGELLIAKFSFSSNVKQAHKVGLASAESYDDLSSLLSNSFPKVQETHNLKQNSLSTLNTPRDGIMSVFSTIEDMKQSFITILSQYSSICESCSSKCSCSFPITTDNLQNVLHVILTKETKKEEQLLMDAHTFFLAHKKELEQKGIRRITIAARQDQVIWSIPSTPHEGAVENPAYPGIYTFRHRMHYQEDSIVRHMEAPLAYMLELKRLSNYNVQPIQLSNRSVHIYLATPKSSSFKKRFFVRAIVRVTDRIDGGNNLSSVYDAHPGPERMFVIALNALELAMGDAERLGDSTIGHNHVFLSVLPDAVVDPQYVEAVIRILASRYADLLRRLKVAQVEFKIQARFTKDSPKIPIRLIASNPTGFVLRVESYIETKRSFDGKVIFACIGQDLRGELDGKEVNTPYSILDSSEKKRELANKMSDTLYIYDFLELFESCLLRLWKKFTNERKSISKNSIELPAKVMDVVELVLSDNEQSIIEIQREQGENNIGMVAWKVTFYTPEYPQGRECILIGNDITWKAGSFGTKEDVLFELATKYAREQGIPRIYLAANSGARIGMAESIKKCYQVAWKDEADPLKGFDYLYLTKQDYERLSHALVAERIIVDDEERWIVKDIIGEEPDLGVENLRGSGTIAGETSRAYDDIFTLTYVCGRTVGIGAYLVRLGHRTIQNEVGAPIILTGYQALNKLMGREVYSSNDQLGGVKIMHRNGISHTTVSNHLEGVHCILKWLSFVPSKRGGLVPPVDLIPIDPVDRSIDFMPTKTPYDPRHLLTGVMNETTKEWCSGFFDKGSFFETLDGWAKTVVTGRARLGGLPMGVILTEVRTTAKIIPADPAAPLTQENLVNQAGQVWFPDSASKTATAIKDFQREDLPLIIFANWRGFSGGQRDMLDEILKFGACVVDALVNYTRPVFVYIPPFAELRGGAWVVIDPTINSKVMEMYSDDQGRGGVLEPAGLIEIKYRKKELIETMHRIDVELINWMKEKSQVNQTTARLKQLDHLIKEREKLLLVTYTQIATQFADLHDTPGRMKAKGAIRAIVSWKNARSYFYWRLRRRLATFELLLKFTDCNSNVAESILKKLYHKTNPCSLNSSSSCHTLCTCFSCSLWEECDRYVVEWFEKEKLAIEKEIMIFQEQNIAQKVMELGLKNSKAAAIGMSNLLKQLDPLVREQVMNILA